jgi:hypothetical protein
MVNQLMKVITNGMLCGALIGAVPFMLFKFVFLFVIIRLLIGIVGWPLRSAWIRYRQQQS